MPASRQTGKVSMAFQESSNIDAWDDHDKRLVSYAVQ
jgi:hypothetical protein